MMLEEQVRRAERAQLLLDDPMIKEALNDIKQTIIGAWSELAVENKTQADELKRLLWAAKQFESIFEVTIAGGAVARNELLNQSTMQIRADAAKRKLYG